MSSNSGLPKVFEVSGFLIPAVGFGTFQGDAGNAEVRDVVLKALKSGYRHIDTASAYGNEKEAGKAIKESGIDRSEIFVTTKLAQTWHNPDDVEEALNKSLENLQLDYVDLYLMHFPHAYTAGPNHSTIRQPNGKPVISLELSRSYPDTWAAMEKLVTKKKTRLIGLSNFNILKTSRLLKTASIRPAVNQIELHPYLPQAELLAFFQNENIHVMAHQPLGGRPVGVVNPNAHIPGPLFNPEVASIAVNYRVSPAQVLLSWAVQRGTSVVPKTVHENRMKENLVLVKLSEEHMDIINSIWESKGPIRYLDPRNHIGFDIFDEDVDQPA